MQNRSKFGPKIRCKIIKDCELRWVQQRLHATDPTGWNPAEVGCKEIKWSLWILIFNCHRIHIFCCISEFSVPTVLIKIDGDTNRHCTTFDRHAKQREWTGRKIIIALLDYWIIALLHYCNCNYAQASRSKVFSRPDLSCTKQCSGTHCTALHCTNSRKYTLPHVAATGASGLQPETPLLPIDCRNCNTTQSKCMI